MAVPTAKQIDKRTREYTLGVQLDLQRQAIRAALCASCYQPIGLKSWLIDDSATGEQMLVHEDCEQHHVHVVLPSMKGFRNKQ